MILDHTVLWGLVIFYLQIYQGKLVYPAILFCIHRDAIILKDIVQSNRPDGASSTDGAVTSGFSELGLEEKSKGLCYNENALVGSRIFLRLL